jgi:hypothetical protein
MLPRLLLPVVLLLISACSGQGMSRNDPHSTLYPPPVGSKVLLHQALEVPANQSRVFLQQGEVVSKKSLDRYVPNCNFEVRSLEQKPRVIEPGEYPVVKVRLQTEEVVWLESGMKLAFAGAGRWFSGQSMVSRAVHLTLGSDLQPDLMRLTCRGAFDEPAEADLPSITQIDQALGKLAQLELP